MNGVYIKDFAVPERCEACIFLRDIGDATFVGCLLNFGLAKNRAFEHRHVDCPLVPIEHRGRLLDEREVLWAFDDAILDEAERTGMVRATRNELCSVLDKVPTVLPEE